METRLQEFVGATVDFFCFEAPAWMLAAMQIGPIYRGEPIDGVQIIAAILLLLLVGFLSRRIVRDEERLLETRRWSGLVPTACWAHFLIAVPVLFMGFSFVNIGFPLAALGWAICDVSGFFVVLRSVMIIKRRFET